MIKNICVFFALLWSECSVHGMDFDDSHLNKVLAWARRDTFKNKEEMAETLFDNLQRNPKSIVSAIVLDAWNVMDKNKQNQIMDFIYDGALGKNGTSSKLSHIAMRYIQQIRKPKYFLCK